MFHNKAKFQLLLQ